MTNFRKSTAVLSKRAARVFVGGLVGLGALIGASREASAQGWLADRKFTEGPGIRAGDLELHPGIGGEVGYDSNWFGRSSNSGPLIANGDPNLPPRDAAVLRLTPSFYVSTLSQQRLSDNGQRVEPRFFTFRGGISATGRMMIGKEMSDQASLGLAADARGDFNAGNPVAFGLFGGFNRVVQPQVFADPNLAFTRDDVRLGADVTFLPGGGTLDIKAGYQFGAQLYETSQGSPYTNINHEISVRDRWRFRPRTALFSDSTLRFLNYPNAARATFLMNDATPLRTRLGLTGLVSNRFGLLAAVGYGATFFKNEQLPSSTQFDSIIGQAEGTIYLGSGAGDRDLPGEATLLLSTVSLGFLRDYQTSLLSNSFTYNRVYSKVEYWFGGRVVLNLGIYGEQVVYPPAFFNNFAAAQTGEFANYRIGGDIFAEYRFTQSLGLNTTINYIQQFSDTTLPAGPVAGSTAQGQYDQNYRRLQAFLGFCYFY